MTTRYDRDAEQLYVRVAICPDLRRVDQSSAPMICTGLTVPAEANLRDDAVDERCAAYSVYSEGTDVDETETRG